MQETKERNRLITLFEQEGPTFAPIFRNSFIRPNSVYELMEFGRHPHTFCSRCAGILCTLGALLFLCGFSLSLTSSCIDIGDRYPCGFCSCDVLRLGCGIKCYFLFPAASLQNMVLDLNSTIILFIDSNL